MTSSLPSNSPSALRKALRESHALSASSCTGSAGEPDSGEQVAGTEELAVSVGQLVAPAGVEPPGFFILALVVQFGAVDQRLLGKLDPVNLGQVVFGQLHRVGDDLADDVDQAVERFPVGLDDRDALDPGLAVIDGQVDRRVDGVRSFS